MISRGGRAERYDELSANFATESEQQRNADVGSDGGGNIGIEESLHTATRFDETNPICFDHDLSQWLARPLPESASVA